MSKFTRNAQRRHHEAEGGWVYNTSPIRDSIISPRTPAPAVDPRAEMGLALAAIEAAIDFYGPHSDQLSVHLQEARTHVHASLQALT